MAQKRKPDQTKKITEAALNLAGRRGWNAVTLASVARQAKVPLKTVQARFSDVWSVLDQVLDDMEAETNRHVDGYLTDNWRDNLLEILMTRFDIAQAHRAAFKALLPATRENPALIRRFMPRFYRTMDRMLFRAGAPRRFLQPVFVAGFGALYISIIDVWTKDDTADLTKTMAAIDKRLNIFQQAVEFSLCNVAKTQRGN